jgi:hypothetical protein
LALSPLQIEQLNAAAARVASGTGTDIDRKNLSYATANKGYVAPSSGPTATATPPTTPTATPTGTNRAALEPQGYQYLGSQDKVTAAIQQYGADRVKSVAGNYYVVPPGMKPPSATGPIPANGLPAGNAELSKILGANIGTNTVSSDIAGLLSLYGATTNDQKQYDELTGQLTGLMKQTEGQGADLQAEMDKQGVGAAVQQVKELSLKSAQLKGELDKFDVEGEQLKARLEEQAIPTGLIVGQQAQLQKQRDLTRLSKAAELSSTIALTQAYQGNAQLGMELAQKAVDMKYQPLIAKIETLKTQIGFASDKMNRTDQNRAKIIGFLLDQQLETVNTKKQSESKIQELAIQAAANGAPLALIKAMQSSGDPAKAASLASKYLKGNLESVSSSTSSGGSGTNAGGGSFTKDSSGGLSFTDKRNNPITAAQYAANLKQNLIAVLRNSSNPNDQGEISDIQSVINDVNSGKYTVEQAYAAVQQNKQHIFSGISIEQFKTMLGLRPPTKTTTSGNLY